MVRKEFLELEQIILDACAYGREPLEERISASQILNDDLQIVLSYKYGSIEDTEIGDNTIGSICHLGLENIFKGKDNFLVEHTSEYVVNDIAISGTADLVDTEGKIIYDYKVTKNYTRKMFQKDCKEPLKSAYIVQLNINRWLIEKQSKESYDVALPWFLKDSKKINGEKAFYIDEVPKIDDIDLEELVLQKTEVLNNYIEHKEMPGKCSDLWTRKDKAGNVIDTRCELYCGFKNVCPYRNNKGSYSQDKRKVDELLGKL